MAMQPVVARITQGGQVSLPAEVRRRWAVSSVLVIDDGDQLVVRPIPDDPISALLGAYAGPGPSVAEMRARARDEDAEHDARRA